jgi:tetratricopeptide (TPR) repeat protein
MDANRHEQRWKIRVHCYLFVIGNVLAFALPHRVFAVPLTAPRGTLQAKRGEVRYTKPAAPSVPATVPLALEVKDQLGVGESSWALLRFQDASEVKLRELTELEIVEPALAKGASFRILKGEVYVSGLQESRDLVVRTPHAKIVPGGSEFLIRVTDRETEVTVFDGQADVSNPQGNLVIRSGQQGAAEAGQAPRLRAAVEARNIVQWWLYYPAVLDPAELGLALSKNQTVQPSLDAYRQGDLLAALERFPGYPAPPTPATEPEKIYLASLLLAVGSIDRAEAELRSVSSDAPLPSALYQLVSAVTMTNLAGYPAPRSASEWLACSYRRQAARDLTGALTAAREAVQLSPEFAFGWERVAELEFSFGRVSAARAALERSLALAPRNAQAHALHGFLLSAENHLNAARAAFEEAVRLDPGLANGWLGLGLVRIRQGERDEGLADLQTAAAMEPNRSFLRSYLAKAYSHASQFANRLRRQEMLRKAAEELALASRIDPKDPTPWLYAALLERDSYRFNPAVRDLERSVELNENRQVYRSDFLLDQDRAVRSSSLANVYQSAGLRDLSLNEAARAVQDDYANASAHMFVSDSYSALRDPARVNLRYETAWFAERLLAYLLGPVGSTPLTQNISQQEYSRLFEANRLGFASLSEYRSDGQFHEQASQFGNLSGTSYSLDLDYQQNDGVRPNNDLGRIEWYSALNQQVGPYDSLFLQAKYLDLDSGDNFQYYNQNQADPDLRVQEWQKPWVIAGWHHEWTPGAHTLLMVGRVVDNQRISDLNRPIPVVSQDPAGNINGFSIASFDTKYQSDFEAYVGEWNQIFQGDCYTLIFGTRFQQGTVQAEDHLQPTGTNPSLPPSNDSAETDFNRISAYGYGTLEPVPHLFLTAGLSYDQLVFPLNWRQPPVSDEHDRSTYLNPKTALVWNPLPEITLRSAYARSLGGVSYDESFRLEPTQLAGFNQSFRSMISESVAGPVTAPLYQIAGAAMDLKLKTHTYAGLEVQWLNSDVLRRRGVFVMEPSSPVAAPSSLQQHLVYNEHSAAIWLNQLVADYWSFGLRYQFTRSELNTELPDVPVTVFGGANNTQRADLHRITLQARFQHPSGFFALAEGDWYQQSNVQQLFVAGSPVTKDLPGDSFGQANAFVGFRFPRQLGELSFGVMNIGGGDYHLNPLNVYAELPHERVWTVRLLVTF